MGLSLPATKDSTQLQSSLSTFDLPEGRTLPCAGLEPGLVNALQKKREEFCMRKSTSMAVVILLVLAALSSTAFAQKATVLRVVVVKTDDVAAYVQEIEKGRQVMKSIGIQAQTRVWQAKFAGPEAGAVVVSIEYPSMTAFADAVAKTNSSSEYQAWLKGLDKLRKIVSDSLYTEW